MKLTIPGLAVLVLAVTLLLSVYGIIEGFGSPGTYVQLATSHVPTEKDAYYYSQVYPREVRSEIANMTGEDPGPLKTYLTPLAGTYYL